MIRQWQWGQTGASAWIAHSKLSNVCRFPATVNSNALSYSFSQTSHLATKVFSCAEVFSAVRKVAIALEMIFAWPRVTSGKAANLIRLIFFHRFGPAYFRFFADARFPSAVRLLSFVNLLENICDHRCSGASSMHFAADVALVERSERESWLIGRQKSREPRRRPLFVLWSPLRSAGFPSGFNVIKACSLCSAAGAIHAVDHPLVQFVQGLGGEI